MDGKVKQAFVNTLMRDYFNITPPDKHHRYVLRCIDNNNKNNSLGNLKYEIFTEATHRYKPEAFHVGKRILNKRCGCCGEIKKPSCFGFSSVPTHKGSRSKQKTYRNICEKCRAKDNWKRISSDPEKKRLAYIGSRKSLNKPHVRRTFIQNRKKDRDNLSKWYVNRVIKKRGMNPSVFTEEMVDIVRISISIRRELKIKK
jgi:hypothetical protein